MRTLILAVAVMLTTVTSLQAAGEYGAHSGDLSGVLDPAVTGGQSFGKSTEVRILAAMEKACGFNRPDFSKSSLGSVSIPSITPPSSSAY